MILVFGSFVLGDLRAIKEFGLADGILVDAVIIRSAVVPSLMVLLGSWWFPRWLDRALPRVHVDAAAEAGITMTQDEPRALEVM